MMKTEKKPKKYLINLPPFGINNKFITITTRPSNIKGRSLMSTVDNESWLTDEICIKIRNLLNTSQDFQLIGNKYYHKNDPKQFIEIKTAKNFSISPESRLFKEKLNEYKLLRNIESKKTFLGGLRKLLEQNREKIDKIFNNKWIDNLIKKFNEWDMCHANKYGEQKITKKGYVIKHKNEKILNWTEEQFNEKCDELYKNVDQIYKLLETNKMI